MAPRAEEQRLLPREGPESADAWAKEVGSATRAGVRSVVRAAGAVVMVGIFSLKVWGPRRALSTL